MTDIEKLTRRAIRELMPYSSARSEFSGKEGVFLDANENPFGALNRYPDPLQKTLRKKIAGLKGLPEEHVFIGNGSDEVIDLAYRIFCEPGADKALAFTPTYGMYEVAAGINAVAFIRLPLSDDFQIRRAGLEGYFHEESLKLIFICSPNNPTGNLIRAEDIKYILLHFKGIVLIDEAYIEFSSSASWLSRIKDHPNLIVCQTMSKAWGLAGARIGIAYASEPIIRLFNKVKPPYNVSALNQEAALAALREPLVFESNRDLILSERKKMEEALGKLSFIKKVYPSDANFLLVEAYDAGWLYQELAARQIITRNRSQILENCLRITVGSPAENQQLVTALNELAHEKSTFYRP